MKNDYFPNLSGKTDQTVERSIIQLFRFVYLIRDTVNKLIAKPTPLPDMNYIRRQLQSGGNYPLNVIGLLGTGGSSPTPSGSIASYIQEETLTADTTITSSIPSPAAGDLLTIFITEDSTGFWKISFSGTPSFNLVKDSDIDIRPGKVSVLQFVCRTDGNWWLTSILLGRS